MSNSKNDIPGFHGDGDPSIELHHEAPATWTGKMTAWSIAIIAVATLLAIVAVLLALSSNK